MNMTAHEISRFVGAIERLAAAQERLAAVEERKMQPIRSHVGSLPYTDGYETSRNRSRLHEGQGGVGVSVR